MKLLTLQKLCYLHTVSIRHVEAALRLPAGVKQQEVVLNKEEVTQTLNRMFLCVSQEVPGHMTLTAPEETCNLMFRMYNRLHNQSAEVDYELYFRTSARYRCMKCMNLHVCQSCFLTDKQTKKHKTHHPVLEFCTQPTWRESLSSLLHSARHALLPRRYTRREADRRRGLMWAEPKDGPNRATPPSDSLTRLADSVSSLANAQHDGVVFHDASAFLPLGSSSKGLQTEDEMPSQQSSVLAEVRNLQRDKWLLEQELQSWRLAVQSEQGILEDRCSEMEVAMETLRQHNAHLQGMLTQALHKMETTHTNSTLNEMRKCDEDEEETTNRKDTMKEEEEGEEQEEEERVNRDGEEKRNGGEEEEESTVLLDTEEEEEEAEWSEEEIENMETPSAVHQGALFSRHDQEEELTNDVTAKEADTQREGEDRGTSCPEELLEDMVDRLKTAMFLQTDSRRERQTADRKTAELLEAADEVRDAIHNLMNTITHTR
ncbi:hypothetical protein LDENG_00109330 [Lucifuga dentata]|nr:hypothetical protein LDENG_00109330 [Lucifuga dentata]